MKIWRMKLALRVYAVCEISNHFDLVPTLISFLPIPRLVGYSCKLFPHRTCFGKSTCPLLHWSSVFSLSLVPRLARATRKWKEILLFLASIQFFRRIVLKRFFFPFTVIVINLSFFFLVHKFRTKISTIVEVIGKTWKILDIFSWNSSKWLHNHRKSFLHSIKFELIIPRRIPLIHYLKWTKASDLRCLLCFQNDSNVEFFHLRPDDIRFSKHKTV